MPEIKAFKGWRYKRDAVGNFASVLAPPYDVISPKQRDELYKKNPFNVVRLILGKTKKGDTARHNQYTRARQFLNQWISKSVLTRDHEPAIYVYAQDYKETGKVRTRLGFLAAMRINEKAVLKHENTLAKPKKDRTALLKEVRTNLSPIFGLFEDKKGSVQEILKESLKSRPVIDVSIEGVRHRLYVENRRGPVSRLSGLLAFRPMFIADGHHRFEVACQFRNWMNSRQRDKDAPWNYVMTYFSDCLHNPFRIFPTHRLISIPGSVKNPLELLKKRGHLTRAKGLPAILSVLSKTREESGQKGYSFGVYKKGEGFFIFNLSPRLTAEVKKNPVDRLDVAVLHRMLIEPCFKIRSVEKSSAIEFTRDAREAQARVDDGGFDLALFLRPTSLGEMILASKKGLKMPQKSTYFYPKLLSGLVFHCFENDGVLHD